MPSIKVDINSYVYDFEISDKKTTIDQLITIAMDDQLIQKGTPRIFIKVIPENGMLFQKGTKIMDLIDQHIKLLYVRCINVQGLELNGQYFARNQNHMFAMKLNAQNNLKARQNQIAKLNEQMDKAVHMHRQTIQGYNKIKAQKAQMQTKLKMMQGKNNAQLQIKKLQEQLQNAKKNEQKIAVQNKNLRKKVQNLQDKIRQSNSEAFPDKLMVSQLSMNNNIKYVQPAQQSKLIIGQNCKKSNIELKSQSIKIKPQVYQCHNNNASQIPYSNQQYKYKAPSKIQTQEKMRDVNPSKIESASSNLKKVGSDPRLVKKQGSNISNESNESNEVAASHSSPYSSSIKQVQSSKFLNNNHNEFYVNGYSKQAQSHINDGKNQNAQKIKQLIQKKKPQIKFNKK